MSLQQNAQNDDSDTSDSDSADENRRRRVFKNRNRFVFFFSFLSCQIIFSSHKKKQQIKNFANSLFQKYPITSNECINKASTNKTY